MPAGRVVRAAVLLALVWALAACGGVLDPKGPIGAANLTILVDSLAIMLAIVVPTILAIARLRLVVQGFEHEGTAPAGLELLGQHRTGRVGRAAADHPPAGRRGLDRIAHAGPLRAHRRPRPALRGAGGVARLEVALHLPGARRGQQPDGSEYPALVVFRRHGDQVRLFWAGAMSGDMADPGQDPRGAPDLAPLWNVLDLTPDGRGTSWYPKLSY